MLAAAFLLCNSFTLSLSLDLIFYTLSVLSYLFLISSISHLHLIYLSLSLLYLGFCFFVCVLDCLLACFGALGSIPHLLLFHPFKLGALFALISREE